MIKVPIYDMQGTMLNEVPLPEKIGNTEYSVPLIHEVITGYMANKRSGTACTKTRSEVRGGGAKPWKQKHTGRARAGSIRSPLWRKGGIVFGPKPRSYRQNIPKGKLRKALNSALKYKAEKGNMLILKEIIINEPKTRLMHELLKKLKIDGKYTLMVVKTLDKNAKIAARNIENLTITPRESLNSYDVLKSKVVVFSEEAFNNL